MVMRRGVILALLVSGSALAAGPLALRPGMGGVADLGAITCAKYMEIHPWGPAGMEQAALTWAEGYMFARSGMTMDEILAAQPTDGPDWNFDTLTGHIVDYCATRPDASVPEAVASLWEELRPSADN